MRILFSFIIVFLFTILVVDESSAQMMQHGCQEDKHMGGAMEMANCSCPHEPEALCAVWSPGVNAGLNHCSQSACSGSFAVKDVGLGSNFSSYGIFAMVLNTSFSQSVLLPILGTHRTGVPPPRLPSTPTYLRNCSFLI